MFAIPELNMTKQVIYFIGSDMRVGKETIDEVKKIEGFDKIYTAPASGFLPSDGYVAHFNMESEMDIVRIKRELSKTKGVEGLTLIFAGTCVDLRQKDLGKKN